MFVEKALSGTKVLLFAAEILTCLERKVVLAMQVFLVKERE